MFSNFRGKKLRTTIQTTLTEHSYSEPRLISALLLVSQKLEITRPTPGIRNMPESRCIQKTTAPGHANPDRKQLQPEFELKVVSSLIQRSPTALKISGIAMFFHVRHVCQPWSHHQPRLTLGKNSCWTMPFFPKVWFGFLRQLLRIDFQQRKNERGAGFSIAGGSAVLKNVKWADS
jgi:hypothetical protein